MKFLLHCLSGVFWLKTMRFSRDLIRKSKRFEIRLRALYIFKKCVSSKINECFAPRKHDGKSHQKLGLLLAIFQISDSISSCPDD